MSAPLRVSRNLDVRDAVARAIVCALEGNEPVGMLRQSAAMIAVPPGEADAVAERIEAAVRAVEEYRAERVATAPPLEHALVQGALLFRAGLFFEVHEVLETAWRDLAGAERTAVQGLIQIAVAMHHLGHDNPRGAVSLFASGRAKLAAGPAAVSVEVAPLLAALTVWEAAAEAGAWPTTLAFPPFVVGTSNGRRIGDPS